MVKWNLRFPKSNFPDAGVLKLVERGDNPITINLPDNQKVMLTYEIEESYEELKFRGEVNRMSCKVEIVWYLDKGIVKTDAEFVFTEAKGKSRESTIVDIIRYSLYESLIKMVNKGIKDIS